MRFCCCCFFSLYLVLLFLSRSHRQIHCDDMRSTTKCHFFLFARLLQFSGSLVNFKRRFDLRTIWTCTRIVCLWYLCTLKLCGRRENAKYENYECVTDNVRKNQMKLQQSNRLVLEWICDIMLGFGNVRRCVPVMWTVSDSEQGRCIHFGNWIEHLTPTTMAGRLRQFPVMLRNNY